MTERCGGLSLNQAAASTTPPPPYLTIQTNAAQWYELAHQSVGGTIHAVSRYASTNPQRDIPLTPSQPVPQSSRLEISQILPGEK